MSKRITDLIVFVVPTTTEFDEIVNYLETYISQLDYEWALLYLMSNVQPESYAMRKNGLSQCLKHLEGTRRKRFQHSKLYDLLCEWDAKIGGTASDSAKRAWIDQYLKQAQLNGLHLKADRSKTDSLIDSIQAKESKFVDNVAASASSFSRTVLDPELATQLPYNLRLANKDGRSVTVTLEPTLLKHFLTHCGDDRERSNVWHANNVKASMGSDKRFANNILIDEIRFDKRRLANMLGFETHVDCALQDKMATSIGTVNRFVDELHKSTREAYNNDLQSLLRFASDCKEFTGNYLNLWDIPYFVNLTKQYEFRVEHVRSYFPLPSVLNGLFRLLNDRFGIQVLCDEKQSGTGWSSHVQLYRLVHHNEILGSFYLDPYANVRQVQVHQIATRCDSQQTKPISAVLLNFEAPLSQQKTLLDFEDVVLLFRTVSVNVVLPHPSDILSSFLYTKCTILLTNETNCFFFFFLFVSVRFICTVFALRWSVDSSSDTCCNSNCRISPTSS
jgi:Zn-dependent oligopeptidase